MEVQDLTKETYLLEDFQSVMITMMQTMHVLCAGPFYELGYDAYTQKTCDVAEKAILAKKKLRKKCVNRDIM